MSNWFAAVDRGLLGVFMIGFLVGVSTSGILFLGLAWRGDSWFGLVAVRLWAWFMVAASLYWWVWVWLGFRVFDCLSGCCV